MVIRSVVNGVNRIYDTDDERFPFFVETPRGDFHVSDLLGACVLAEHGGHVAALKVKLELVQEDGFMTVHRYGPWRIDRQSNGSYRITHTRTGEWANVGFNLNNVRIWLADEEAEVAA